MVFHSYAVSIWLRRSATSQKVAGSSPYEVTLFFSIHLILPAALDPVVYSASERNAYQKIFLGVKRGWRIRLTMYPPSMSRLSRQCGILNISQPYRPPRPVTGISLLYGDRVCFL
jgi:hypothetical protein